MVKSFFLCIPHILSPLPDTSLHFIPHTNRHTSKKTTHAGPVPSTPKPP